MTHYSTLYYSAYYIILYYIILYYTTLQYIILQAQDVGPRVRDLQGGVSVSQGEPLV